MADSASRPRRALPPKRYLAAGIEALPPAGFVESLGRP